MGPSSLGPSFSQILLSLSLEENIVLSLRDTENFVREGKFKFRREPFLLILVLILGKTLGLDLFSRQKRT